jgi:uncharacterized protein (DUF305 family)
MSPTRTHRIGRFCLTGLGTLVLGLLLASCSTASTATGEGQPQPDPSPDRASPGSAMVQPGAPGSASRHLDPSDPAHQIRHPHTEADVLFMQNMIHHHEQALQMARMVPDRTDNPQIRLLAHRIDRSQMDEIRLMQRWLADRGEEVPEVGMDHDHGPDAHAGHEHHAHHEHHAPGHDEGPLMAGMLTEEQLQQLADARDAEFDRLLLEFMIYHHEGAIQMVEDLFASYGAGQDSEIFRFASHVDSDQRIEIGRMGRMLQEMSDGS